MFHLYAPWKNPKIRHFLMFSRGVSCTLPYKTGFLVRLKKVLCNLVSDWKSTADATMNHEFNLSWPPTLTVFFIYNLQSGAYNVKSAQVFITFLMFTAAIYTLKFESKWNHNAKKLISTCRSVWLRVNSSQAHNWIPFVIFTVSTRQKLRKRKNRLIHHTGMK